MKKQLKKALDKADTAFTGDRRTYQSKHQACLK
jgi:hypothetical protein